MATFAYKAHLAARSSKHHSSPPRKQTPVEEPVSPAFHPPVLARAHAHQIIHSRSNTTAPRAAAQKPLQVVNLPAPNKFASQGPYRARIFIRGLRRRGAV